MFLTSHKRHVKQISLYPTLPHREKRAVKITHEFCEAAVREWMERNGPVPRIEIADTGGLREARTASPTQKAAWDAGHIELWSL